MSCASRHDSNSRSTLLWGTSRFRERNSGSPERAVSAAGGASTPDSMTVIDPAGTPMAAKDCAVEREMAMNRLCR